MPTQLLSAMLLVLFPCCSFAQNFLLTTYPELESGKEIYAEATFNSLGYYLEEGVLPTFWHFEDGVEPSADLVRVWACEYLALIQGDEWHDTVPTQRIRQVYNISSGKDVFIEQAFLIQDTDSTFLTALVIRITFADQHLRLIKEVKFDFSRDTKAHEDEQIWQLYQERIEDSKPKSGQIRIRMEDLPPPPPINPGEEERHQEAVDAFRCNP